MKQYIVNNLKKQQENFNPLTLIKKSLYLDIREYPTT